MNVPLVEVTRGRLADAIHVGALAIVDADGTMLASAGDPAGTVAYLRSAAKPFQAMCVASSGAGRRWRFSPEDMALIAGSHNGEPVHVARARALLTRIGMEPGDLACGTHPPLDPVTRSELLRGGAEPTVLHNNCSGKHIGMLALARQLGAPPAGYSDRRHPVQQMITESLCRFVGLEPGDLIVGVDGCGVPCFGLSVRRMAMAFARLMKPGRAAAADACAARTVRSAMMSHPYLVAGRDRLDTALMTAGRGALLAKGGAGGVQCVGIAGGLGLAVKALDGADAFSPARPAGVAAVEALRQLGALDEAQAGMLGSYTQRPLRNLLGEAVGQVRPVFRLSRGSG